MQIRYPVDLTVEEYTEQKAWKQAELDCCPFHPEGGCGCARHGSYPRKFPEYCLVARWYCPKVHQTISLLPDFFASRLPGTLDEVEHAVNVAQSSGSQEEAAYVLRPEISLISGLRWLRRRIKYVKEALTILAGLLAAKCAPELKSFRKTYNTDSVLIKMRDVGEDYLPSLPPIVGFGPRSGNRYCHRVSSNN